MRTAIIDELWVKGGCYKRAIVEKLLVVDISPEYGDNARLVGYSVMKAKSKNDGGVVTYNPKEMYLSSFIPIYQVRKVVYIVPD
jgi:hypothetical protein